MNICSNKFLKFWVEMPCLLQNEKLFFNTYEMSFKRYNGEKGKRIPITKGLYRSIKNIKPDVLITEGFFQWDTITSPIFFYPSNSYIHGL